jgi:hypothetical protein
MPRSTKGRAAARGLDARLILQHASCLLEMLHSKQLRSIKMLLDSNHGIYRYQIQGPPNSSGSWQCGGDAPGLVAGQIWLRGSAAGAA